jgi:hypothetical protein
MSTTRITKATVKKISSSDCKDEINGKGSQNDYDDPIEVVKVVQKKSQSTSPPLTKSSPAIETMIAMGFDGQLAQQCLEKFQYNLEAAVEKMLSSSSPHSSRTLVTPDSDCQPTEKRERDGSIQSSSSSIVTSGKKKKKKPRTSQITDFFGTKSA